MNKLEKIQQEIAELSQYRQILIALKDIENVKEKTKEEKPKVKKLSLKEEKREYWKSRRTNQKNW